MTEQELNALMSLLARCPLTPGEQLWLQALVDRLTAAAKQAAQEQTATTFTPEAP